MAKKEKRNVGKTFFISVLIVLLVGAILGAGVYFAWRYTDGFERFPWDNSEENLNNSGITPGVIMGNYYIEQDGVKYGDGGVARLTSGSTFTVGESFGTSFTVKMTARAGSDFSFTLGAEPYKWNNVKGDDFTAGFTIARNETGFTISYSTLEEIIAKVKGNAVTITDTENASVGDKFTMTVSGNGHSIDLNFIVSVSDVVLDPDKIIFGGET